MNQKSFQEYLATGAYTPAMDAEPNGYDLSAHDRRFHKGGYKEGDRCNLRDALKRGDSSDDLAAAERSEASQPSPYDPPAALGDDSLMSLAKTDPDVEEACTLASDLNRKNGWGISGGEVVAYEQAFRDMDAGRFPYGLPEFEGKLTEENFNDGDFSGESKDFRAFVSLFGRRPDLIRPYVIERLTDANFHEEAKALQTGTYKTKQEAQDSAAEKYLSLRD